MHFFGHPHPARAFAGRLPRHFYRHPHPARAFVGIPMRFFGHPHPARAFAGIPMHFSGSPHPTRAFGAPPPPPPRGRGPCVAIPGGKSVSGVEPAGNRIRLFPTYPLCTGPWCIRHWGRRPAGRGNASPLPCPLRPPDLTHLGNPTRAPCRHPPPRTR